MDNIADFLCQVFLGFLILIVSVGAIYHRYFRKSSGAGRPPPGNKGLPLIGETFSIASACKRGTPEKFILDRISKYSPDVFCSSLYGDNVAVFCGAPSNKFLMSSDKYLTPWWPLSTRRILLHPSTPNTVSFLNESSDIRGLLSQFLKPESLQNYIHVMDSMSKEHLLKEWLPCKQVKVFPLIKKHTFTLTCRLFASLTDPDRVAMIAEQFSLVTAGLMSLPINFPGTVYSRALKAGERIHEELLAIILKRKMELQEKKLTQATDMLTSMLLDGMSEIDTCNKLIGFLLASHETTSCVITFMIKYLALYPHVYSKVFQEQMEILESKKPGEFLTRSDINRMKYTWCVACEVMRMAPASAGSYREAKEDFTYAGYAIPKEWKDVGKLIQKVPKVNVSGQKDSAAAEKCACRGNASQRVSAAARQSREILPRRGRIHATAM